MVETQAVKGNFFNLTKDGKHLLRGWYLLVAADGREYVVKNNWTLFPKKTCQCYKVNRDLSSFVYTRDMYDEAKSKAGKTSVGIAVAIIFGSAFRHIFPVSWFLGVSNIPVDVLLALRNILVPLVVLALFLIAIAFYRSRVFLRLLQEQEAEITQVGTARMTGHLAYTPQGRKLPSLGILPYYVSSIFLISLITLPVIFVEYRLMAILVALAFWEIFFSRLTINPNDSSKTFELVSRCRIKVASKVEDS